MFKNYLRVAWRNIWKSRLHSFITLTGLSTGIACCILIVLFVKDEWTFDDFHSKADRIYRAWVFEDYGENEQFFNTVTPYPLGPALVENFSEVAGYVRINQTNQVVEVGVDQFNEQVTVVTPSFFDVFDFEALYGKPKQVLNDKDAVVITRSVAQKYFGMDQAVGETLTMYPGNGERIFTVKAVVDDVPGNSSVQFELLISELNNHIFVGERELGSWYHVMPETYVVLREDQQAEDVIAKTPLMMQQVLGEDYVEGEYTIGLQPLLDIHLNNDMPAGIAPVSDPQYAYILGGIALLILFLGCVNFVTLSISRSVNRSKEVGVRKVVGAQRSQLILQFLCEAVIMAMIATLLGLLLAMSNLSLFNELSGKQLVFEFNTSLWLTLAVLMVVIGIISGSYPALLLSAFRPVAILKGKLTGTGGRPALRQALVGIQFVLTIFLISTTLLMKDQLNFLQNKNLGFDKNQLAVVQMNIPSGEGLMKRLRAGFEKGTLLCNELNGKPGVMTTGIANHTFGSGGWTNVGFTDNSGNYRTFDMLVVDEDFMSTANIRITEGRGFTDDHTSDARRSMVVNRAFAEAFNMTEAIVGQKLPGDKFGDHEIIGMAEDFNYNSLHGAVDPLVMVINPMIVMEGIENIGIGSNPLPKVFARLQAGQVKEGLASLENAWKKVTGGEEFEYTFVDQTLAAQYDQEQNLSRIVTIAAALAIIIGCMGLFALASLNMENRTREVSIRKVLGASQQRILVLLSREYVYLILIAMFVSIPLTVYVTSGWLETFAYRISVGPGVFAVTGGLTVMIALCTISWHAIRTTMKQPAETLKYE